MCSMFGMRSRLSFAEQAVLYHLRDEHARRHDDVVAARALGRDELGDELLVRRERVERDRRSHARGEFLEQLGGVVVAPRVDREAVLDRRRRSPARRGSHRRRASTRPAPRRLRPRRRAPRNPRRVSSLRMTRAAPSLARMRTWVRGFAHRVLRSCSGVRCGAMGVGAGAGQEGRRGDVPARESGVVGGEEQHVIGRPRADDIVADGRAPAPPAWDGARSRLWSSPMLTRYCIVSPRCETPITRPRTALTSMIADRGAARAIRTNSGRTAA